MKQIPPPLPKDHPGDMLAPEIRARLGAEGLLDGFDKDGKWFSYQEWLAALPKEQNSDESYYPDGLGS